MKAFQALGLFAEPKTKRDNSSKEPSFGWVLLYGDIVKLTMQNYQGHEISTLEFASPGINAIVGKNGHGKSSVFRALRSVPLGDSLYRRKRTRETRVTLDGCTKGYVKSKNIYDVDGTEFKALRNLIPKEVTDRLGLKEVNFRSQHQPYFLLHDSPGAVARAMNELTDLGVIDYISSALKAEAASLKGAKDTKKAEIGRIRAKITALDWAVEADEDLKVVEGLQAFAQEVISQEQTLQSIINHVLDYQEKLGKLPPAGTGLVFSAAGDKIAELDTTQLESTIDSIVGKKSWLQSLPEDMTTSIKESTNRLSKAPETATLEKTLGLIAEYELDLRLCPDPKPDITALDSISFADCSSLASGLETVEILSQRLEQLSKISGWEKEIMIIESFLVRDKFIERLETASESISSLEESFAKTTEACYAAEQEFNQLLQETGECPLCGKKQNNG